jgi:hypothetical protein
MAVLLNALIPSYLKLPEDGNYPQLEYHRYWIQPSEEVKGERIGKQGYLLTEGMKSPKTPIYFCIQGRDELRMGKPPHQIRNVFLVMGLANIVIFGGTLMIRAAQTIIILGGAFFRAHKETYKSTEENAFADLFFEAFEKEVTLQKQKLYEMKENLQRDIKCFVAMELTAVLGICTFDPRKMVQMHMIWGAMEYEWNQKRSYSESFCAHLNRWRRYDCPLDISAGEFIKKVSELAGQSNGAFYLLECAQVRSASLQNRLIVTGEDTYSSYEEITNSIRQKENKL